MLPSISVPCRATRLATTSRPHQGQPLPSFERLWPRRLRAGPPARRRRESPRPGSDQVQPDRRQAGGDYANGDLESGPHRGVKEVPAGVSAPREHDQVSQADATRDEDEDSQAEHDQDSCLAAPGGVEAEDKRERQHEDGQILRYAAARCGVH